MGFSSYVHEALCGSTEMCFKALDQKHLKSLFQSPPCLNHLVEKAAGNEGKTTGSPDFLFSLWILKSKALFIIQTVKP